MNNQMCLETALFEAAKEVFETAAFMEIAECKSDSPAIEGDCLLGSITFKGALEGCMTIRCSSTCAGTIARAMLGMDPSEELSGPEVADTIGEVTNMVLGTFKARVRDSMGDLEVSIPSVVMGQRLEGSLGENTSRASLKIVTCDGHPVEIGLL
jgi:CheY-specific phosphatase CheX